MYSQLYIISVQRYFCIVYCTTEDERPARAKPCYHGERKVKIMALDASARDNYLTLALFSRRVIEALKELVQKGKRERLNTALPDAIQSLEAVTDSRHLTGYGLRVARSYDQVRTINELFPKQDRIDMIAVLRALQADNSTHTAKAEALKAINFFYMIENRALQNYRHPAPRAHLPSTR
jgi:hypothetical protein